MHYYWIHLSKTSNLSKIMFILNTAAIFDYSKWTYRLVNDVLRARSTNANCI